MMLTIHSEECGHRQRTASRDFHTGHRIYLMCHECEAPLTVEVLAEPVAREVYRQAMAR